MDLINGIRPSVKKLLFASVVVFFLIAGSTILSFYNYLLFHTIAELFSIVIAFMITTLAINSYSDGKSKFIVFLGVGYFFIGSFDLIHTLAFKGMGVFPNTSANLPTQLWIIARYIEAFTVLAVPFFLKRSPKTRYVILTYSVISIFLAFTLVWGIFPDSFIEGQGLTPFKIISEYIISGILLISLLLFVKNKDLIEDPIVFRYIILAYATTIATELCFTLYVDVYGLLNMLGHVLKIISFYFIYLAVVKTNLELPYKKISETTSMLRLEMQRRQREESQRKKMEQELLKASKLDSIATLAGGIAHDFNNLLTIILGNASLAKYYAKDFPECLEKLVELEKACKQATGLTQQLLTFSKGGEPIKKTVAIDSILQETTSLALSGSNVLPSFDFSADLNLVDLDEDQFKQVVNNILINARQAMPNGGIITIKAENTVINSGIYSSLLSYGSYVKISIKDQGIGISKENVNKIFDPFFSTKEQGHGLGLSSAFSIIKKHQGYITVDSEEGVGTTFYIYLPASSKLVDSEYCYKTNLSYFPQVGSGGKVLVMDDDSDIQEILTQMLGELGFEVDVAVNGTEAVQKYSSSYRIGSPYDLVILDLTIPGGVGGKEVAQKLLHIDKNIKLIFSSGYSNDKIKDLKIKNKHFLKKPYTFEELNFVIESIANDPNLNAS